MSYDTLKAKVELLIEKAKSGGVQYTDIVYNDDNTVTLTDTSGVEHTISCVYENNRLLSMTYDGKEVVTVYDNGKLVGVGETEVDIANAPLDNTLENLIDQSGVLDSTDETVTVTEKVEQLIDKAEDENIWYEISKNWTTYQDRFRNAPIKRLPRLSFENATNFTNMCSDSLIETFDYYVSNKKTITTYNYMFRGCSNLKFVKGLDASQTVNFAYVFFDCKNLETIQMPLNLQVATNTGNIFTNCTALKNISFVAETIKVPITIPSPVLSKESISGKEGIINGLNSTVTGQTLTIPRNAVKKAFETSEGANDGDTSETWKALVASKPNWTITLS